MPVSSATTDDAFIVDVARHLAAEAERAHAGTAEMIDEYLRRRAREAAESAAAAAAAQLAEAEAARMEGEARAAIAAERERRLASQLAAVQAGAARRAAAARSFALWRLWAERRRLRRAAAAHAALEAARLLLCRHYERWRAAALARRAEQRQRGALQAQRRRESELLGQVEALREALAGERRRGEALEARLRDAFVSGVAALNREAVAALRGPDAQEDAAAIHDILSGRSSQAHRSASSAGGVGQPPAPPRDGCSEAGRSASSSGEPSRCVSLLPHGGALPARLKDERGVLYHACYDPQHCPVVGGDDTASTAATAVSSAHEPFVVRANASAARRYDAGATVSAPRQPQQQQQSRRDARGLSGGSASLSAPRWRK